jgi:DNA-binding protein WhiA
MIETFSKIVKDEIMNKPTSNNNSLLFEYQALMDLLGDVKIENNCEAIVFTSHNVSLVKYFLKLSHLLFQIKTQNIIIEQNNIKPFKTYVACFYEKTTIILDAIKYYVNRELTDIEDLDLESKVAYLKGAFLATGSINNPSSKDYHLEISTDSMTNILYIGSLLNSLELNAKIAMKKNKFVCYIKRAENIASFLARVEAMNSYFKLKDAITMRSLKVQIQRQMNTEIANEQKTITSSNELIKDIQTIRQHKIPLPSDLDDFAKLRIDYPDLSLSELINIYKTIYNVDINKSMLYRKFDKIKNIALKLKG